MKNKARKLEGIEFFSQGMFYHNIIAYGPKMVKGIQCKQNVSGLLEDLSFTWINFLSMLFKDDVRVFGVLLGLTTSILYFTVSGHCFGVRDKKTEKWMNSNHSGSLYN